jgi:hypothetical protein
MRSFHPWAFHPPNWKDGAILRKANTAGAACFANLISTHACRTPILTPETTPMVLTTGTRAWYVPKLNGVGWEGGQYLTGDSRSFRAQSTT